MAKPDTTLPPVIIGVTGGIAAYKVGAVIKALREHADMYVVMTDAATKLVGPSTFANLTGHPVLIDLWDSSQHGNPIHIDIADLAKALCIVPCTANVIGKLANGIADDALTTLAISVDCPVIVAPAMNTRMWNHPIVQDNLGKLARFGYHIVPPGSGWLACGTVGAGRLAEEGDVASAVINALAGKIAPPAAPAD
ncbi:MAG: flavoprotein [Planctomycetota bacterium]